MRRACNTKEQQRGFTIIELFVTFAVMTVVLGITVMGEKKAQNPLKVINNAYDVALFVREAQVMGTSVTGGGFSAVGVYLQQGSQTVIMFRDANDNARYDASEELSDKTIILEPGVTVSALAPVNNLSIVFRRPFLNACIDGTGFDATTHGCINGDTTATITVTLDAISRNVVVTDVGRISVP